MEPPNATSAYAQSWSEAHEVPEDDAERGLLHGHEPVAETDRAGDVLSSSAARHAEQGTTHQSETGPPSSGGRLSVTQRVPPRESQLMRVRRFGTGKKRNIGLFLALHCLGVALWLVALLLDVFWISFLGLFFLLCCAFWLILRDDAFRENGCHLVQLLTHPCSFLCTWLYVAAFLTVMIGGMVYFNDEQGDRRKRKEANAPLEVAIIALGVGVVVGVMSLVNSEDHCCNPTSFTRITEQYEVVNVETELSTSARRKRSTASGGSRN